MNQSILKDFRIYLAGKRRSEATISQYVWMASKFLYEIQNIEDLSYHDAEMYQGKLMLAGAKEATQRSTFYALKWLYAFLQLDWPSAERPIAPPRTVDYHSIDPSDLIQMIHWAKKDGSKKEKAFLAVSSIYGVRREELTRIHTQDITEDSIYIRTAKGGDPRRHVVPAEISLHLTGYHWPEISPTMASLVFKKLMWDALAPPDANNVQARKFWKFYRGFGWHCIRHTLATSLYEAGITENKLDNYMRWKNRGWKTTQMHYIHPKSENVLASHREIDEQVFEIHPFLREWS